ncbi:RNA polymerase sigma-70 factor (ECF subfamily) [Thermosporothrix hazakensis]|jgi:RNA polymerase sigma-70 factor (ECF subfamily)|uniref:RNA polymerase sigma-70 factor (ECF subfamily) n=2 Tax=Thermosporothrix TaxID=768650 RepID=A0A326UGG9_THEHA|nr:sigma-70 family RNA polymerase sigma factor [Thermosporothrix hazakensis]PZW36070.1 RNA polymerase sigma-70 factor (ECF subfamily) [Thermosporothrix hazakensis]BBH88536.1 RNA polymerase sigma-H factor [Thermosporothrix sp. COM3]GCE46721.1 RNA polymerase sigma-H factor [Thermosporothrix hazakensis]
MVLSTLSDKELVARCKQELPGSTGSYELLVQRYMHQVYRVVYGVVHQREDAEDITQEVFLKVYNGLPRLEKASSFPGWLYRIAANTALDALEKMQRRKSNEISLPEPQPVAVAGLEDSVLRAELRECIQRVLCQLKREQVVALVLRDFEGRPYEEISRVLEVEEEKQSTVKMRIHRARLAFQKKFIQMCEKVKTKARQRLSLSTM